MRARRVALLLAVLTLVAGVATALSLRGAGIGLPGPARSAAPRAAAPPAPVLSPPDAAVALAPTPAGMARDLAAALADPAFGARLSAAVLDVATGQTLLDRQGGSEVVPASTAKLVTAAAVLTVLSPTERITTRVTAGSAPGEIVLVGAGDPTLTASTDTAGYPGRAGLDELAAAVARAGVTAVDRLVVDDTLFAGPALGPGWKPGYVTGGNVAPVTALMVDGGRLRPDRSARAADPAVAAGTSFAALLQTRGVVVRSAAVHGRAQPQAQELARVESPPVGVLVEEMLSRSDNDLAESLARLMAIRSGLPATFDGAGRALGRAVAALGLDAGGIRLVDGSGLSPDDRVRPVAVARLLALAAGPDHRELRPLLTGLPVAGFAGTLADRYRAGPAGTAAGAVRAKSGTLTGVSALAGVVVDDDGRLIAFDVTADGVPSPDPRPVEQALDRLAAALAGCGCR